MPRPSMLQRWASLSKARIASPRNTAAVGPNFTRIEPRQMPSPWSGASCAPGMHPATTAGLLSRGHTSMSGEGIRVCSVMSILILLGDAGEEPAHGATKAQGVGRFHGDIRARHELGYRTHSASHDR